MKLSLLFSVNLSHINYIIRPVEEPSREEGKIFPPLQYTEHILFIHSFIDGHLGGFHLLTIANSAAGNPTAPISPRDPAFRCFGCVLRSGIPEPYGSSIFNLFLNFF